ncbi:MAG: anti-sigma factor [Bacteroidia bacterium]|nr:anti-sigma factor [Bacteroidia bacterium]
MKVTIREYIESGNLELYVAGKLPPEEAREVEAYAETFPEIREEIEAIRDSLEAFAGLYERKPSDDLLSKIKQKIAEEDDSKVAVVELSEEKQTPIQPLTRKTNWRFIAIAAAIAFLLSVGFNLLQYLQLEEADKQLALLTEQQQVLAENYNKAATQLSIIKSQETQVVTLAGLEKAPQYSARVYWDKSSDELYLSVGNLFNPETDKQFQLWAIVDGKPVDLGVFDNTTDLLKMKSVSGNVAAFAVTLEPRGGSINPTLEQMFLLGKLG